MNYQKIYYDIIYKAKYRKKLETYTETHHIYPKSLFPEYKNLKNHPWNGVDLTAKEHFICHHLLSKTNNNRLIYAFNMMFVNDGIQQRYKPTSYNYEYTRKMFSKYHPCKQDNIKKKISNTLLLNSLKKNIGAKCVFKKCKKCKSIMYVKVKRFYCSEECYLESIEIAKKRAAKQRADKRVRISKEELSEKLSKIKKESLSKLAKEEMRKRIKNSFGNCDNVARGNAISKGKKGKKLGMNSATAIIVEIYNNMGELMYVCEGNFNHICKEFNLPKIQLANSYRNDGKKIFSQDKPNKKTDPKIFKKFKGWYAIKK